MSEFNATQELEIEETYRDDEDVLHIAEMFADAEDADEWDNWKKQEHAASVAQDVESVDDDGETRDIDYYDDLAAYNEDMYYQDDY